MLYKFADFYIEMTPHFDYTLSMAEMFKYSGDIPHNGIFLKLNKNITPEFCSKLQKDPDWSHIEPPEIEHVLLAEDFFLKILPHNSIMLHASAVKYKGRGILFSAPSKTGKSTHVKLWKKIYGDSVHIINDDKPIIRYIDGVLYAYGTPFAGGTYEREDDRAVLDSIVFIKRAETNSIKTITNREALPLLYSETMRRMDRECSNYALDMFDLIFKTTKFYQLSCNMEDEAAILARNTILKDDINES